MTRAQRKVFAILTEDLSPEQRSKLDQLLEQRERSPYSVLSWLRMPPGAYSSLAILEPNNRSYAARVAACADPDSSQRSEHKKSVDDSLKLADLVYVFSSDRAWISGTRLICLGCACLPTLKLLSKYNNFSWFNAKSRLYSTGMITVIIA